MANMKDLILKVVEDWMKVNMATSIPAKVTDVSSYSETSTISVQPVIGDIWSEDNLVMKFPEIFDVPVLNLCGGGAIISVPIQVGDIVQLETNMRNTDNFVEGSTEEIIVPNDASMFDLNNCIAKPCIYSKTDNLNPNPDDLELRFMDSIVRLKSDGNITISTKGNIVIEEAVDIEVTNSGDSTINTTGNVAVNNDGDTIVTTGGEVTLDVSQVTITGDLQVDGAATVDGLIESLTDVKTPSVASQNAHLHTGNLGSPTSPPTG